MISARGYGTNMNNFKAGDIVKLNILIDNIWSRTGIIIQPWYGNKNEYSEPAGYYIFCFQKKCVNFYWSNRVGLLE